MLQATNSRANLITIKFGNSDHATLLVASSSFEEVGVFDIMAQVVPHRGTTYRQFFHDEFELGKISSRVSKNKLRRVFIQEKFPEFSKTELGDLVFFAAIYADETFQQQQIDTRLMEVLTNETQDIILEQQDR